MPLRRLNHELEDVRERFRVMLTTLVASAFGFVAALFWNDAIRSTIETLVPAGSGLFYKYLVAVIVTVLAVAAIYSVSRLLKVPSQK